MFRFLLIVLLALGGLFTLAEMESEACLFRGRIRMAIGRVFQRVGNRMEARGAYAYSRSFGRMQRSYSYSYSYGSW